MQVSRREWFVRVAYGISGVVIAAPGLIGAVSTQGLAKLYGLTDPGSLELALLQHRAVLLSTVGILLLIAIWSKPLRPVAAVVAIVSNITFIGYVALHGAPAQLSTIAAVDIGLTVLLIIAICIARRR